MTYVLGRRHELHVVSQQAIDLAPQADTTHYANLQGSITLRRSRVINGSIFADTLAAIVVDKATNQHAAMTNFRVAYVDNARQYVQHRRPRPHMDTNGSPMK